MDNASLVAVRDYTGGRSRAARAGYAFAALAVATVVVLLVQERAADAQFDFSQIICAILLAVYNAFVNSPFFGFVQAILEALLDLFNCVISPG